MAGNWKRNEVLPVGSRGRALQAWPTDASLAAGRQEVERPGFGWMLSGEEPSEE